MRRNRAPELTKTIQQQRRRKGISQAELGRLVGMPQSQIARIERGGADFRLSTLINVARALDLEPMLVPKHLSTAVGYMSAGKSSETAALPKLVGNEPEELEDERDHF